MRLGQCSLTEIIHYSSAVLELNFYKFGMPVINSIMSIILCAKNAMNTLPTTYKIRYRRIQDTVRLA